MGSKHQLYCLLLLETSSAGVLISQSQGNGLKITSNFGESLTYICFLFFLSDPVLIVGAVRSLS